MSKKMLIVLGGIAGVLSLAGCGDETVPRDQGTGPRDAAVVRDAASGDDATFLDATPGVDGGAVEDAAAVDGAPAGDAGAIDADLGTDAGATTPRLPPANAPLDYQLGGAYAPPSGVAIVSRDRTASPAPGLYNICYVNGFQSQPDENDAWLRDHRDLVLHDASGEPVIDTDWNELLFDIRTPAQRAALSAIVGGWIMGCATAGFDAVEIDNLDTYSRSNGLITPDHAVAFMRSLADVAHAHGLAIAQKNSAEILSRRGELGTDFAVVEECNRWMECADFVDEYGDGVLVIEYRRADFTAGCRDFPGLSIVLRDLDLVPAGQSGYVFDGC